MDQGFTYPSRNQSNWDTDLNENFRKLERGFVFPAIVGPVSVVTGHLVIHGGALDGTVDIYSAANNTNPHWGVSLQATSPGNVGYFLRYGGLTGFAAYSGQGLARNFYASVITPGWVTSINSVSNMVEVGRYLSGSSVNAILFSPEFGLNNFFGTSVNCGISHAASAGIDVFSFTVFAGRTGYNTHLRVQCLSCDNYRVTFYSNSARTTVIYDTAVLSGNLSVRTIDMIDDAIWPYSLNNVPPNMYGIIYGAVQVLSSAATAINSQAFQVSATWHRQT